MYFGVTFSTKILTPSFGAMISVPAFLVFASSLLPVRSVLLTIPPCDPDTITRGLPEQQVAAARPGCTGRDFDAIFRAAWLILYLGQAKLRVEPVKLSTLCELRLAVQVCYM